MAKKSPKQMFKQLFYRYLILMICIVTSLVIFFIALTRFRIKETNLNYMSMMVEKAADSLEESAKEAEYIHSDLYQSLGVWSDMLQYFVLEDEEYLEYRLNTYVNSSVKAYEGFNNFVDAAMQAYTDIVSIELISYSKSKVTICYPNGDIHTKQNAKERMREVEAGKLAGNNEYSFVREIREPSTMAGVGCMIVNFKADELQVLQKYYNTAELVFTNTADTMIFKSDTAIADEIFLEYEDEELIAKNINAYVQKKEVRDYVIYGYMNKQRAAYIPPELFFLIVGIGAAIIVIGVFFIRGYLVRLADRLNAILDGMSKITTGDLEVRLRADQNGDELDMISSHFNEMCRELDIYINKSYLAEIEQKNAELEILQNQINPHFLYNTLEAIRMKAITNGDREVGKMLYSLSVIFRSQLKADNMITIIQEMHYCKKYMELFEYRYKGKFTSNVRCPDELIHYTVMKFTLQPLVENYFMHGIRTEQEGNTIDIWAEKSDGFMYIHLEDNGKGMSIEELEAKNEELRQNNTKDKKSIGIVNVNRRVKAVYGNSCGIMLKSGKDGGLHVIVKVGLIEGGTDA